MTDYKSIVNDLLGINDTLFAIGTSNKSIDKISIRMAFDKNWHNIAEQAAAAIEALENALADECAECDYLVDENARLTTENRELQAQLPKLGEWIEENRRPRSSQFVCSECHRTAYDPQPTRDKAWRKRCRYAYCPNCGAKMTEVQDG